MVRMRVLRQCWRRASGRRTAGAETTNLARLARKVAARYGVDGLGAAYDAKAYANLHRWSIDEPELFWGLVFEDLELTGRLETRRRGRVNWPETGSPGGTDWFVGSQLNHAEILLEGKPDDHIALIEADEKNDNILTYGSLKKKVASFAHTLKKAGIREGSKIAAVAKNDSDTVAAMLAVTSLGAAWASVSPELGEVACLSRLSRVQPDALFVSSKYTWKGQEHEVRLPKFNDSKPEQALPTVKYVFGSHLDWSQSTKEHWTFLNNTTESTPPLEYCRGPANRPVYVMFSSGTTGPPKCMVQGIGATLIHAKEAAYHFDCSAGDPLFWYTTTSWMMWNWLIGAGLSTGGTALLYDGDPFARDLWDLASTYRVAVFGASAGYLARFHNFDQKGWPALKAIGSTGSPAAGKTFDWVRSQFDIPLVSTSGGTDLNGSLCTGNPWIPVKRGTLQCAGLGLDVGVLKDDASSEFGELCVKSAFPSAPLYFLDDPSHEKYRAAYFSSSGDKGIWHHGDLCMQNPDGSFVITGRSDATLNAGGVRIGSAEIYDCLPDPNDALVVPWPYLTEDGRPDVRIALFLKKEAKHSSSAPSNTTTILPPNEVVTDLKARIRRDASPRHVPFYILYCPDIPTTHNGKKMEVAVARALSGRPTDDSALANPAALDFFRRLATISVSDHHFVPLTQ